MAWNVPLTFASNSVLDATSLNLMLRDNMNETAPAKASKTGTYFASSATNTITEYQPLTAVADGNLSVTSTTYVSGYGPSLTFRCGGQFLVMWSVRLKASTGIASCCPATSVSGTVQEAAADYLAVRNEGNSQYRMRLSSCHLYVSHPANTLIKVDLQYRTSGTTAAFGQRSLIVLPL